MALRKSLVLGSFGAAEELQSGDYADTNTVYVVADYTRAAVQAALDAANTAGGGTVFAPDGLYSIDTTLTIGSNTKLVLAGHAVFQRSAAIDAMLLNKSDGVTGGYGQATNIEVTGGTWDMNGPNFASTVTGIATGHARYIYIHDTTLINGYGWHYIELNSTQQAVVRNVVCRDYDAVTTGKEMLQLDLCVSSVAFPWFGPYDSTPVDDILVEGCSFINGCRGIGSHSATAGKYHTNIRIIGNHFITFREYALYMNDYQQVIVQGNTFNDCWYGIYSSTIANQICKDFVITGNVMTNMKSSDSTSRGIYFDGGSTTARYMRNIIISNNVVRNTGRHAIGCDYCRYVSYIGNEVQNCGGTGIWAWRATNVILKDNVAFSNNTNGSVSGVGDIGVGSSSGSSSDTADIICQGNMCGTLYINYSFTNRVICTTNNMTGLTTVGTKAEHQVFSNYINSVWTP